jgi:hypothetical protein
MFIMKTSQNSDELKKKLKGGGSTNWVPMVLSPNCIETQKIDMREEKCK